MMHERSYTLPSNPSGYESGVEPSSATIIGKYWQEIESETHTYKRKKQERKSPSSVLKRNLY
jgi:hypothetical protein